MDFQVLIIGATSLSPECFFKKFITFNLCSLITGVHMLGLETVHITEIYPGPKKCKKISKNFGF